MYIRLCNVSKYHETTGKLNTSLDNQENIEKIYIFIIIHIHTYVCTNVHVYVTQLGLGRKSINQFIKLFQANNQKRNACLLQSPTKPTDRKT